MPGSRLPIGDFLVELGKVPVKAYRFKRNG